MTTKHKDHEGEHDLALDERQGGELAQSHAEDHPALAQAGADQKVGVQPLLTPNPATLFTPEMTIITGNQGGTPQQLIPSLNNGNVHCFSTTLALNGQASGSIIACARLPLPYTMVGIQLISGVSLGTTTLAFGRPDDPTNNNMWSLAAVLTTAGSPVWVGGSFAMGAPQYTGADCLTGQATGYQPGHQGGALYDDVIMTTGVAALPVGNQLRMMFFWMI
jgi:hypothetical protein